MTVPPRHQVLLRNRRARHDYHIEETIEAGLILHGGEVKSLRAGQGSLIDAYVENRRGELWLVGAEISPYPFAHGEPHNPKRDRKLLLHQGEIRKLQSRIQQQGYTLIPLELYDVRGKIKVSLAVARGRREYEKRDAQKKAEAEREVAAALSRRR